MTGPEGRWRQRDVTQITEPSNPECRKSIVIKIFQFLRFHFRKIAKKMNESQFIPVIFIVLITLLTLSLLKLILLFVLMYLKFSMSDLAFRSFSYPLLSEHFETTLLTCL